MQLIPMNRSDGPPLVFMHGWASDSQVWQPVARQFFARFSCYGCDLPGFGVNHDTSMASLDSTLQAIASVLPHNSIIVGWSLGGMLALQLANRYPRHVKAVVSLAANLEFVAGENWPNAMPQTTYNAFLSRFARQPEKTLTRFVQLQIRGEHDEGALTSALTGVVTHAYKPSESGEKWQKGLELLADIHNINVPEQVKQPQLYLFGEGDHVVPAEAANDISARFGHLPHVAVACIQGVGHAFLLSQADDVAERINCWLNNNADTPRQKEDVARSFSRAAQTYEQAAELQKNVALKLASLYPIHGHTGIDIGVGTGFCSDFLEQRFESCVSLDIAKGMLQVAKQRWLKRYPEAPHAWLMADMEHLPLAPRSVDGIISSLCIQWSESATQLFSEFARILRPQGQAVLSTLGPKTLNELRHAWQSVDDRQHVNRFTDLDELTRAIESNHLKIEQQCTEMVTLYYPSCIALMKSLKAIGAHNVNADRQRGLTSASQFRQVEQAYSQYRDQKTHMLPVTYEVYYFHLSRR